MQKDGSTPSKEAKKGKNERYTAASQPKVLSLSSAKRKATKFAAKNDKSLRVGAKRAILRELNSHLVVRAQGIRPPSQSTANPYGVGQPVNQSNQTKSRAKKPIDKQPPKPGDYTWNKNGRPEELRIRYVARKYLLLWIGKVYGRLHPHVARAHYQHRVKLKVLKVWQDIWWSGRKGWKLNIRAEYHNRYRTWVTVWRSWRAYVMLRRVKTEKLKRALTHSTKIIQGKCMKVWKQYVKYRRLKTDKLEQAHNIAALCLKRWVWLQWMSQMEKKRMQVTMEHTALKYWAFNLLAKSWACWTLVWNECRLNNKKMVAAESKADRFLLIRALKCWRIYHSFKKLKAIKRRVAVHHYNTTSALRALKTWKVRWQRNRQLAQFDHLIIYRGNVARARRIFSHWKFYVTLQYRTQADEAKAVDHYLMNIKRRCFHALHHYKTIQHHKYTKKSTSQEFWYKLQLKRVWMIWLQRCDHSEELKIYPVTRRARSFHRLNILNKSMYSWQLYWKWRRHRRILYSIADKHYNKTILPRCLRRMERFVEIMKEKRENQMEADLFRREVLLTQVFYKWHREYQLAVDVKMLHRMAILHHDDTIKTQCLTVWMHRTRQEVQQHELQARADYHCERQLLVRAITDWKNFARAAKISRYYHQTAVRHYYLAILGKIWSAWSEYVEQRSIKWRKLAVADIHYQHGVLRKLLNAWKIYHSYSQRAVSTANQKFNGYQIAKLRWTWSVWRHYVGWHKNKCILHQRAKAAHRNTILKKVLTSWHIYACHHALQVEEQAIACQERRVILNQGKLQRSFHAWVRITKISLHKTTLYQISEKHYRKILCRKALAAWLQFIQLSFRIKLLRRQSQWLHNHRIIVSFFRHWKHQYATSIQTRKKTSLSLWHWSVTLQRKAFHALLQYAITKKQKEIRITQALDQRRTRLIKSGCTQWIKVAFDLASTRNRYAQARHVQQANNIHQYVYKCAIHWRKWTAQRIAEKPQKRQAPANIKYNPCSTRQAKQPVQVIEPKEVLSDLFKPRPKPRVPDYLRASFDVSSIGEDKEPLAPSTFNLVPSEPRGRVPKVVGQTLCARSPPLPRMGFPLPTEPCKDVEETPCPRPPPPPCTEVMPHPRHRSSSNDSMALLLSSDGEGDVPPVSRQKQVQPTPKLLPPSSFKLPASSQDNNETSTSQDDHKKPPCLLSNADIKTQIFEARKKLQQHYNMKLRYRNVMQEQDDLIKTREHDPNCTEDLTSRQLTDLNTELDELSTKIERDKDVVQQVAVNIQHLIQRVTTDKQHCK